MFVRQDTDVQRQLHSYRDLPIRMGELGLVLGTSFPEPCITMRVGHRTMPTSSCCRNRSKEIAAVVRLVDKFYRLFGFSYHVELSTRPRKLWAEEIWDRPQELWATLQNWVKITKSTKATARYGRK